MEITKHALKGLKTIFKKGCHYKRAGIILMVLSPTFEKQFNLFQNTNARHLPIMGTLDKINSLNGSDVVKFGGMDLQRKWKMKRNLLSPNYTSKLKEIITVNAKE